MKIICYKCKRDSNIEYKLEDKTSSWAPRHFCSKVCLVRWAEGY